MRIRHVILGAASVALLAACGTSTAAPQATSSATTAPTTTTTTTTAVAPTTTTVPTTTVAPTTTRPRPTTTKPTTTKPTTTKPKPKPTTTAKPAAQQAQGAPCGAAARACIDLSANRAWLLSGGKVTYGPVPITHGRPGWRTPPGTFKVGWKNIDHKSSLFNNAPMPYSVFFNGGIAFHQGSLREQSHGCIHLSAAAAKTFFQTLKVGDTVQVVR